MGHASVAELWFVCEEAPNRERKESRLSNPSILRACALLLTSLIFGIITIFVLLTLALLLL